MKNKKYIIIILILAISIGFAYLSTNLNILGNGQVKGNTFDIHFENIQVSDGSVEAATPVIDSNKTTVNYEVTLNKPGDYYEFTVDVVNAGTLDGMIGSVNASSFTDEQAKYLETTYNYSDGTEIGYFDILKVNTTRTLKIRVLFKKDISVDDMPSSDVGGISCTFSLTYFQDDGRGFDLDKNITIVLHKRDPKISRQVGDVYNFYYKSDNSIVSDETISFLIPSTLTSIDDFNNYIDANFYDVYSVNFVLDNYNTDNLSYCTLKNKWRVYNSSSIDIDYETFLNLYMNDFTQTYDYDLKQYVFNKNYFKKLFYLNDNYVIDFYPFIDNVCN